MAQGGWMLFNLMSVARVLEMKEWMGAPMISWGQGVEGYRRMVRALVDKGLVDEKGS